MMMMQKPLVAKGVPALRSVAETSPAGEGGWHCGCACLWHYALHAPTVALKNGGCEILCDVACCCPDTLFPVDCFFRRSSRQLAVKPVASGGGKVDLSKVGLNSVQDPTVRSNLMGRSRFMRDKNWVDPQGRKGKVSAPQRIGRWEG